MIQAYKSTDKHEVTIDSNFWREAPKFLTFLHLKSIKSPLLGGPCHGCPAQLTSKILVAQTEIWLRGAKKTLLFHTQ